MPNPKVRVAILWHMHQPYYRDLLTGQSFLPWVRLHAVKDYQSMARIVEQFPEVHLTVNFVPSLIKQILEFTEEGLRDAFWNITDIPAGDLSDADQLLLLKNFFMVNWNLSIKPSPRYRELLEKRGYSPGERELERASALFSRQDFLDLQVWFNLAWFHPMDREVDKNLADLFRRGRNFTEEDKRYILKKQLEIMGRVVPLYRGLMEKGQLELSTSPFYHPILPLLVNQESAREALPELDLPSPRFSRPEDAVLQLERAVAYHEKIFGARPMGLWPSEGSVSEDIVPLVMDRGFSWMASDEDILYKSWGVNPSSGPVNERERREQLYRTYKLERSGRSLSIVFRDHVLSDAIGFTYGHWEPKAAARDLIGRIEDAASASSRRGKSPLVSIILDGENPWEYYYDQGYSFLKELYQGLERSKKISAVTVSEALAEDSGEENIPRLFAGSWIGHNFKIWIGHPEDRKAWELLATARDIIDGIPREAEGSQNGSHEKALEEILIAEGSDWCWWYGDENYSGNDEAFDSLYRTHLKNVFTLSGKDIPDEFKVTIFAGRDVLVPITRIYSFINPIIDGRVSSYFEWLAAGEYFVRQQGMMMHRADFLISAIYFGFNANTLFIRVDPTSKVMTNDLGLYAFNIHFLKPRKARIEITPQGLNQKEIIIRSKDEHANSIPGGNVSAAMKDILEVAVPFDLFRTKAGEQIEFFVSLAKGGREAGHWPQHGYLRMVVPTEDFEEKHWSI